MQPVAPHGDGYMLRQVFWLPVQSTFCTFPPD